MVFRNLPKQIDQLEKKMSQVEAKLQDPALYSANQHAKINELKAQLEAIEADITPPMHAGNHWKLRVHNIFICR